ncbi:MAG TPA: sigma-70 family RNA polymerase sigma factor [Planctomycetaceae bacterium]|nr:sigma-70 family RNA polymerase sigma factor [Planctomycetaceae bacterium]
MMPSDRPQPTSASPHSPCDAPETVRDVQAALRRVREAYECWAPEIRAFLVGLTRDVEAAEELVQVTFGRLVEAGTAAGESSLRGWLFRVAHNEAMLARRKAGVRGRGVEAAGIRAEQAGRLDGEQPPWTALVRAEEVARVRAAIERLPPEQRAVVEGRIDDGRTFAQIASEAGLPLGTVLTRMRLAHESLRKALGEGS